MRGNVMLRQLMWLNSAVILSWCVSACAQQSKTDLALLASIETKKQPYGEIQILRVVIKNTGQTQVSLVMPGEGSDYGWRTPAFVISKIEEGPEKLVPDAENKPPKHPEKPPFNRMGRCGNINDV